MIDCELKPLGKMDGDRHGYACINCKREKWSRYAPDQLVMIHRPCFGMERKDGKGLLLRLTRWEKSIRRWKKAGKPIRTDKEVAALLEICTACEHFDPDKKKCALCGCYVNLGKQAPFNKLRMKTESCPDDPPRWQAPKELREIILEDEPGPIRVGDPSID